MIVAAILAKNEGDRYLRRVLQSLQPLTDTILLLDDGSTDDTVEVAVSEGVIVKPRADTGMWGNESPARQELWQWGSAMCGDGWLLIADADQILVAPATDWNPMLTSRNVDSWAFPLYDCWDSPGQFRADGYWRGFQVSRPWLFRPAACPNPVWSDRGIHTGHAPANFGGAPGIAPHSVYWKHLGWMQEGDRREKLSRYLRTKELLTPEELAHLQTAGD